MDKYLAALAAFPKANTVFWQKITSYFKDYESAWQASTSEQKSAKIPERTIVEFNDFRTSVSPDKELEKLNQHEVNIMTLANKDYPKNLKEIYNPPFALFVKGELKKEDELGIAVVGSRKATDYGKRATRDICQGLTASGITIISGLALGLDTEAHQAAIQNNGRTVAVLANGLDQIYPISNTALGKKILGNGALVSEQPLGMPPLKQNFPARNRLISGLALGVLVTEAGEHSGTLYTANFALEQNRNVYAVPGPIYNPLSVGPNSLLKMGAKPVMNANDILEDYGITANEQPKKPENDDEELIFDILGREPKHIDLIAKEAELTAAEISQILSLMEIKGKVKHLGGMVYCLR